MQCPDCGYHTDDAAVFCPNCRFQFRESAGYRDEAEAPVPDATLKRPVFQNFIADLPKRFSKKEIRLMEVHIFQTAVLVVLVVSLFLYSVFGTVEVIPFIVADLNISMTGAICLAGGLITGLIFFFLAKRSLARFRFR